MRTFTTKKSEYAYTCITDITHLHLFSRMDLLKHLWNNLVASLPEKAEIIQVPSTLSMYLLEYKLLHFICGIALFGITISTEIHLDTLEFFYKYIRKLYYF